MFSWARMYVTRGWCAAVAIAAISSFGAASCGGGGGGGSDTSASGIVTRPSNAGASTVVDQLVEMQTLTGELLDQTTTDGAGRYTVEAADTGTQRIVVPNANAATASNPQPSGPPIRLEALVVPQPGNEVGKSVDGATTIGSVAADISLRAGRTRAEDFTPERIGNLEGAALPLEPQTDFTDSDAVIRTASVVNDLTGDGANPPAPISPRRPRNPTTRPGPTVTPTDGMIPAVTPTAPSLPPTATPTAEPTVTPTPDSSSLEGNYTGFLDGLPVNASFGVEGMRFSAVFTSADPDVQGSIGVEGTISGSSLTYEGTLDGSLVGVGGITCPVSGSGTRLNANRVTGSFVGGGDCAGNEASFDVSR